MIRIFFFTIAFVFTVTESSAQEFPPVRNSDLCPAEGEYSTEGLSTGFFPLRLRIPGERRGDCGGRTISEAGNRHHILSWETGSGKSYSIPAVEIPVFILGVNLFARLSLSDKDENGGPAYETNPSTFWKNLVHGTWTIDTDDFRTNQLKHPYQGAVYQGLARSAGLGFWKSSAYTFAGSFLWETAGETTRPSINDQIASGIGGNFLGEPLFRMASLLLERRPGFWGEMGAAVISPPTALNRLVFGERFSAVFPSHNPAFFYQGRLGYTRRIYEAGGDPSDFQPDQASVYFLMAYGLPGKPGYHYTRPFDYFQLEFTAISTHGSPIENILTRGLLFGTEYKAGEAYRGVWGLFGSYDFISPGFFRVSSTALSIGTVGQWSLSRSTALQATAVVGLGYGAGGSVAGEGQRNYHYGMTGQGLISLRLILGESAEFSAAFRQYYLSDLASTDPQGSENIVRLSLGLTFRIFGRHAIGLQLIHSSRDGEYADLPNQNQRMGTLTFFYALLSDTRFGCVEWRETECR